MQVDKTVAFTGGRNIIWDKELMIRLHQATEDLILKGFDTFNTGLCYGSDAFFQRSLIKHKEVYPNIKIIGFVPHANQSKTFSEENKKQYAELFLKCDEIVQVSSEPYAPQLMMLRNIEMVNRASYLLAVTDESKSAGTWNTIEYSSKQEHVKQIYIIKK